MPRPAKIKKPKSDVADLAAELLAWYDRHRRVLPWRVPKGKRADPYRVWLSEIMLQQTTVQAVAGYYRKFLERWPDVRALAATKQDDVLAAWAGLGYYARARNLHAAARIVADEMGGKFPATAEGLRALPGVGSYTSGAIAAIAYDERQAAMDANAERVIARLYAVTTPLPKAKAELHALGFALVPKRAGDFVQALMDLGSAICTPKRPACSNCPWTDGCVARAQGIQESLPRKAPKRERPLKRGAAFVACDASGAVLLVKRPDKGLLASMLEPPLGPWRENFPSKPQALWRGASRLHPFRIGDRSLFRATGEAAESGGTMDRGKQAGRCGVAHGDAQDRGARARSGRTAVRPKASVSGDVGHPQQASTQRFVNGGDAGFQGDRLRATDGPAKRLAISRQARTPSPVKTVR